MSEYENEWDGGEDRLKAIFGIAPEYQNLSNAEKRKALSMWKEWCEFELCMLGPDEEESEDGECGCGDGGCDSD